MAKLYLIKSFAKWHVLLHKVAFPWAGESSRYGCGALVLAACTVAKEGIAQIERNGARRANSIALIAADLRERPPARAGGILRSRTK